MSSKTVKEELKFVLGDKLQTTYDVAIFIFEVCSNPNSNKMTTVISKFESELWIKSFGVNHVKSISCVRIDL